jgi:flavin reductase (DIM6/NTAB) family NADH-FMN oxidoreductase RutF
LLRDRHWFATLAKVDEMSEANAMDTALVDNLKAVHRRFPTGVTVVAICPGDRPYGLVVNAFCSISLSPPMVLVCVAEMSATYDHLFKGDQIAVNFLAHDQEQVAAAFARSGGDKFRAQSWRRGTYGAPVMDGVCAYLEAEIEKRIQAYTHTIFIARVRDAVAFDRAPLVYVGGRMLDGKQLERVP